MKETFQWLPCFGRCFPERPSERNKTLKVSNVVVFIHSPIPSFNRCQLASLMIEHEWALFWDFGLYLWSKTYGPGPWVETKISKQVGEHPVWTINSKLFLYWNDTARVSFLLPDDVSFLVSLWRVKCSYGQWCNHHGGKGAKCSFWQKKKSGINRKKRHE